MPCPPTPSPSTKDCSTCFPEPSSRLASCPLSIYSSACSFPPKSAAAANLARLSKRILLMKTG